MTLQIRILRRAQADADDIFLWLHQRSPAGAAAWYAALSDKLNALADSAWRGSLAPEARKLGVELQQVLFKTRRGRFYRILFLIVGEELRVLRIRGPGQPLGRRDLPPEAM